MPSLIFRSKRHDTGVSPELDLEEPPAGTDWDLTQPGLVAVFIARIPDAPAPKMIGQAEVRGPWRIRYNPTAADVNTIGAYECEVEVTPSGGKPRTFPTERAKNPVWIIDPDLNNGVGVTP